MAAGLRARLEDAVERALTALDALDGDADLEDSDADDWDELEFDEAEYCR